jgi:murein DD-endopeptidase MepM/ murein hydrolase activator NlpD
MATRINAGTSWGGDAWFWSNSYDPPDHPAVDVIQPNGSIVPAMADGTIEHVGTSASAGLYLVQRRSDGWANAFMHLTVPLKAVGAQVRKGEPIARSGNTGRVTGPHTHVEEFSGTIARKREFRDPFVSGAPDDTSCWGASSGAPSRSLAF